MTVKKENPNKKYYYLRSSVLGGRVVTELHGEYWSGSYGHALGSKSRGYVYAGGEVMAEQTISSFNVLNPGYVDWRHVAPHTQSQASTFRDVYGPDGAGYVDRESDPLGVETGFENPAQEPGWPPDAEQPGFLWSGTGWNPNQPKCTFDGMPVDCSLIFRLLKADAAVKAPERTLEPVYAYNTATKKGNYIGFANWNSGDQYYHFDGEYIDKAGNPIAWHSALLWEGREEGEALLGRQLDVVRRTEYVNVISGDPVVGQQQTTTPSSSGSSSCTIQVYERGIEALKKVPIPGAKHGYIILTDAGGRSHVFEGKNADGRLVAVDDFNKIYGQLPGNKPDKNKKRGEKSGADVCDWLSLLENAASQVNAVNIKYSGKGPNSNSVLRFMLQSLPNQSWYRMPLMIGWKSKLPGVEPK